MHPTTRTAASFFAAALLALAAACGTAEQTPDDAGSSPTLSSEAPDLDRVGSILPGEDWTLVDASGVGSATGEYEVNAAGATGVEPPAVPEVTVTWRPAGSYDGYVADRAHVSSPEPVEVVGATGLLYTYSDHDFTVLRAVEGASFVELRGTFLSRAEFDDFLAGLGTASEDEFTAALADAGVTPER